MSTTDQPTADDIKAARELLDGTTPPKGNHQ